jgi:hypothetical protein
LSSPGRSGVYRLGGIAERLTLPVPILPRRGNSKWARNGLPGQGWYMVYDLDEGGPGALIPRAILTARPPLRVRAMACQTLYGCQLSLWKHWRRSGLRRLTGTLAASPRRSPRKCASRVIRMLGVILKRLDEEWLYIPHYNEKARRILHAWGSPRHGLNPGQRPQGCLI